MLVQMGVKLHKMTTFNATSAGKFTHMWLCTVYSKFKVHCIKQSVWSMNALSKSEGQRVTGGR